MISTWKHKYMFALCSSTDMDRLASFHQACMETKRNFLCDPYQKSVLDIFTRYMESPLFHFDDTFTIHKNHVTNPKIKAKLSREGFLDACTGKSNRTDKRHAERIR